MTVFQLFRYFFSVASSRPLKTLTRASTSAGGKISGLLALSGLIARSASLAPLTGQT